MRHPAAVIEGMEGLGFYITHVYGLTEVYGPAVVCAWHDEWDELPAAERARLKARQGVTYPVLEAAVVARPDPMWGETPCAFVTLKPDPEAAAEDIIAFCRTHLAHFKAPRTVIFGPLLKTSTGKIQKFMLRERAKQG